MCCELVHRAVRPMYCLRWLASVALAIVPAWAHASPFIPGEMPNQPVALVGGTVHPVDGAPIENGVVVIDQGKIVAVGKQGDRELRLPDNTQTLDVQGKHIYPGLIESYSQLGLVEISAVRATRDQGEVGQINPNAKTQVAFNPDSEHIPVTRASGVLVTLTAPVGGLIPGTSSVMQLDGWSWEDMAVQPATGLHISWPQAIPVRGWWTAETAAEQRKARTEQLKRIRDAFADARAYQAARVAKGKPGADHAAFDARWEAMLPVLDGKLPLIISANELSQIQEAVAFAAEQKVKLILHGGYDAPRCATLLKEHGIPVIIAGMYRLPQRRDDPYDAAFTVAVQLHAAGVRFCISGGERTGNERNLPYHAAAAAAYGLPKDVALRSITLSVAEILGLEDRLGSLTAGKDATLIVANGDILEITTQVEQAFVGGRPIDLSSRHTELWKKYREKYRRQQQTPMAQ